MGTTADKLAKLAATKEAIRTAINDKGVEVSETEPFSEYPAKIAEIEDGGIPKVKITIQSNLSNVYFDVSYMNYAMQQETVKGLGVGTYEFPIITSYPVTVTAITSVSGYAKPNIKSKSVIYDSIFQMDYLSSGVYLQANDLSLYTAAEWDSAGLTHGDGFAIVIVGGGKNICISPKCIYSSNHSWSTENVLIDGVVCSTDDNVIAYDYDGLENTRKVIAQLGEDKAPAFKQCRLYKTPQGLSAYFPAAGEMRVYWDQTKNNYARYSEIYDLFSKLGVIGVIIPPSYADWDYNFVSSTQRAANFANYLSIFEVEDFFNSTTNNIEYGGIGKTANWDDTFIIPFFPFITQSDCKKITINTNIESATFTISYTTIYGEEVTLSDKSSGEYYLPIDSSQPVTVTGQFISGYGIPSKTLTAAEDYTFDMEYKLPGVYIRHIDGKEYTTAEWTNNGFTNDEADCVAVRAGVISFGLNTSGGISTYKWSTSGVDVIGLAEFTVSSLALLDYNGKSNTDKIAEQVDSPAVAQCLGKTSPSGNRRYLPSVGEMRICSDNIDEIKSALTAIGVTLSTKNLWTSTEYDSSKAWLAKFAGTVTSYTKTSAVAIWPFIVLPD